MVMFGILDPGRLSDDFVGSGGARTDLEDILDSDDGGPAAVADATAGVASGLADGSFDLAGVLTFVSLLPGEGTFSLLADFVVCATTFGSCDEGGGGFSFFGTVAVALFISAGGFPSRLVG